MTKRRTDHRVIAAVVAVAACLFYGACSAAGEEPDRGTAGASRVTDTGSACVDATGPNSSPQQLKLAFTKRLTIDPRTGAPISWGDLQAREPDALNLGPFDVNDLSDVYTAVPDGADAKFSTAICGLLDQFPLSVPPGGVPQQAMVDNYRNTPGSVRKMGRDLCYGYSKAGSLAADRKKFNDEVNQARTDPSSLFEPAIEKTRQIANSLEPGPYRDVYLRQVDYLREQERNPGLLIGQATVVLKVAEAAVRNMCPQYKESNDTSSATSSAVASTTIAASTPSTPPPAAIEPETQSAGCGTIDVGGEQQKVEVESGQYPCESAKSLLRESLDQLGKAETRGATIRYGGYSWQCGFSGVDTPYACSTNDNPVGGTIVVLLIS